MKKNILEIVNLPADIKKIKKNDLSQLCKEVRSFLIESVAQSGGHFGSSLGVVELTVALHRVFDTPKDSLIWDVGHQSYPHKILTGRKKRMHTIRKYGGLAPFPKREESEYDSFSVGHSSTSISAALGMAIAKKKNKSNSKTVAIIGDGALTGGMALEALNHAGSTKADMLVILNDNKMSISPNVGGLREYLTRLISSPKYISLHKKGEKFLKNMPAIQRIMQKAEVCAKGMIVPGTFFEELGFSYYGPIDGHDVKSLVAVLNNLKKVQGPKFLHIITKKGKGYAPAEDDKLSLHAVAPFDLITGEKKNKNEKGLSYTDVFSTWICDKATIDEKLQAITPAMGDSSGLVKFREKFPDRYHDVGIAEQHAMTFAAGLACVGEKPVVVIYSTFLQRAYDQLIHDVAMQNLNVLLAIDRAGIVGPDGATHAGSFDLSFMRIIPNLVIMAPANKNECYAMLEAGFNHIGPVAVRYPRGGEIGDFDDERQEKIEIGKAKVLRFGKEVVILAYGAMVERSRIIAENLDTTLVNMRFIKPIDEKLLKDLAVTHKYFVTIEDNVVASGAGSAVNEFVLNSKLVVQVKNIGLPDKNLEHGSREEILAYAGLSAEKIKKTIHEFVNR